MKIVDGIGAEFVKQGRADYAGMVIACKQTGGIQQI